MNSSGERSTQQFVGHTEFRGAGEGQEGTSRAAEASQTHGESKPPREES
jgi:hypothetical protein